MTGPEQEGTQASEARERSPGSPQPAAAPPQSPAEEVTAETVADLRSRIADLEDRWRRAVADFDNLRKRVARDAAQQREDERASAAGQWLPVLDNLDRALDHAAADPAAIAEGVRSVRKQALEVLARLGFARRDEVGAPFDPTRHEAVAVVPAGDAAPGMVVRVVRPGYGNDERLLRPASVVVAKGE